MRNMFLLALNILKVTFRKRFNIIVFLILPVIAVLMTMTAFKTGNPKVSVGIFNKQINGTLANDMIDTIKRQDRYNVQIVEEKDINAMVAENKVDCVITIPENFDESIYKNSFNKLQITAIRGQDATGWIQNYVNYYVKNLLDISKASQGDKASFDKLYTGYKNQNLKLQITMVKDVSKDKYTMVQSIGFLIMFMLMGATNTSGLILKEKKERTYNRIFSSPVNSRIYIGGNMLANMIIISIQSLTVIIASKYIFKLNTGVPDIQLLAILLVFGLVSVTLGILLVAFSRTSYQAGSMSTLIITPTCMISGCFWPISMMPSIMQKIANFLPQKWALEAISQLQNGKTFLQVTPYIGILMAFALAFFLIGMYKMKVSNSVQSFV